MVSANSRRYAFVSFAIIAAVAFAACSNNGNGPGPPTAPLAGASRLPSWMRVDVKTGGLPWALVAFPVQVGFLGAMQWDGRYLAIGDQAGPSGNAVIHRCSVSGVQVSCNGGTIDLNSSGDVAQYFIKYDDRGVIGADASSGGIGTWAYPQGGAPRKVIHGQGKSSGFVGAAVLRQP